MAQPVFSDEQSPINVVIMGKNIDITNPIRQYVNEHVEKIEKMQHSMMHITVRIDVQKLDHLVDIVMKFSHFKINVHATTTEMYSAIDKAFDKLRAKLRKWKGKIQDHHAKGISAVELEVNVLEKEPSELDEINDAIEEESLVEKDQDLKTPVVYKRKTRPLKKLTLLEAVMKMELSHDNFLLYKSEEDLKLKVLYRRKDNSYGVISLDNI